MRIIKVPEKVVIKDEKGAPAEGLDIPFKKFLTDHIDNYGETKTVSQLRQAQKVIDKIEGGNGTISLEDAEFDILKNACSKIIYRPVLARQLFAYYDAVEQAEEVKK